MENDLEKIREIFAEENQKTAKKLDTRINRTFEKWSKESDERMERYVGALKEDFDHKLDIVLEQTSVIPKMQSDIAEMKEDISTVKQDVAVLKQDSKDTRRTQDVMFNQIGVMAEDITIIKESVQNHGVRIQTIKTEKSAF